MSIICVLKVLKLVAIAIDLDDIPEDCEERSREQYKQALCLNCQCLRTYPIKHKYSLPYLKKCNVKLEIAILAYLIFAKSGDSLNS
jgi:hypothetical protein